MIRVAVIEDSVSFMKAMQVLVSNQQDMLLVYTSDSLADEGALYNSIPDVVIMDIDLPLKSGIEGVKMLKENLPSANVFMLTVFEDEERIFDSIKAGALGYLLKKDAPEKIIEAVYAVHKGMEKLPARCWTISHKKKKPGHSNLKNSILQKGKKKYWNYSLMVNLTR
jgi:DNA-binding NarL/FixJ family response regulator